MHIIPLHRQDLDSAFRNHSKEQLHDCISYVTGIWRDFILVSVGKGGL